jgi:hypothetical protein
MYPNTFHSLMGSGKQQENNSTKIITSLLPNIPNNVAIITQTPYKANPYFLPIRN